MYKLIASDLDETLLGTDHHVCQRNVDAILAAREKGVRFVPCTGRPYDSVEPTLRELGLFDQAGEYVISFNGGAVTENNNPVPLCQRGLDFQLANDLYQRALDRRLCVQVFTLHEVWVNGLDDEEYAYTGTRVNFVETHEPTLDFLDGDPVIKVLFQNLDMDLLRGVHRDLMPMLGNVDVSYSSNRYLEFNTKGVTKGSGLYWLADYLGVPRDQTIGIGDSLNDLALIRDAALGCVAANAVGEVRGDADYVCESNNDEGAVAEVIEKFVL